MYVKSRSNLRNKHKRDELDILPRRSPPCSQVDTGRFIASPILHESVFLLGNKLPNWTQDGVTWEAERGACTYFVPPRLERAFELPIIAFVHVVWRALARSTGSELGK